MFLLLSSSNLSLESSDNIQSEDLQFCLMSLGKNLTQKKYPDKIGDDRKDFRSSLAKLGKNIDKVWLFKRNGNEFSHIFCYRIVNQFNVIHGIMINNLLIKLLHNIFVMKVNLSYVLLL